MEILYYFKPFNTKNNNNQVDYFLFLLAVSSKYNFFNLFLIVVVNSAWKHMFRFYGNQNLLQYFVISYTFNYVNFLVKKESKSLWQKLTSYKNSWEFLLFILLIIIRLVFWNISYVKFMIKEYFLNFQFNTFNTSFFRVILSVNSLCLSIFRSGTGCLG